MSKMFITGGAGFIGSHLAQKFINAGHQVFLYDSFQQYHPHVHSSFTESMQYRFNVLLHGVTTIRGNTLDKSFLEQQLIRIQPEYVVHLAALPLASEAVRHPEEAFDNILGGLLNVLEAARYVNNLQKLVYVSSSMVYGNFSQNPMPEDGLKKPKDIYGGMKLAGEVLVQSFCDCYTLPYVMVRPSAVYGPTDMNGRVVQQFLHNAFQGKKLVAHNPSTTYLDFTHVEDTATGLMLATVAEHAASTIFNITYGESHSLMDVINILQTFFPDLEVQIEDHTPRYQPKRGALDITRAKNLLDYQPQYPLEVGLQNYIQFVRDYNPSLVSLAAVV